MRYKLIGVFLILLISTPLYGQPITVDTFPPTPTLITTGELFTVNYRVRYLDLSEWNEEIVLFYDEIRPENFNALVNPFEVMHIEQKDPVFNDGEWWQDFLITFRIIDKEKNVKEIPKLQFAWAIKKAGTEKEDLKPETVESLTVYINYFSTVVPDPYLEIRDGLKLGDYSGQAWFYRVAMPLGFVFFLVIWLVLLWSFMKAPKQSKSTIADTIDVVVDDVSAYLFDDPDFSFSQARRALARTIKEKKGFMTKARSQCGNEQFLEIERDLCSGIRMLLVGAIPEINQGDMPHEIQNFINKKIENKSARNIYHIYLELAEIMSRFQGDLETSKSTFFLNIRSPILELMPLEKLVRKLQWRHIILSLMIDKIVEGWTKIYRMFIKKQITNK